MHNRQRMQLINEIRQIVPLFEVVAWDSDIRVQREYPDPLYPETHTMTQTWYIGGHEHWERLRPTIEKCHKQSEAERSNLCPHCEITKLEPGCEMCADCWLGFYAFA